MSPAFALSGEGISWDASNERYVVDFGVAAVGVEVDLEATISNEGDATLRTVRRGSVPSPFSLDSERETLEPGESRVVRFSFRTGEAGTFERSMQLESNAPGGAHAIRLVGEAVKATITCAPTEVELGPVPRGETVRGEVRCENQEEIPIPLQAGTFSGPSSAHFSLEMDGVQTRGATIPAGSDIPLAIAFEAGPTLSSGRVDTSLRLMGPAGEIVALVQVSAFVLETSLVLLQEEEGALVPLEGCASFDPTSVGEERRRALFIRNLGQGDVTVSSLSVDGEAEVFSLGEPLPSLPSTLEPGAELEVSIGFAPEAKRRYDADFIVRSDDPLEPAGGLQACLEGEGGGGRLNCTPTAVAFGPVAMGMTVERSLECVNAGDEIVYVTSADVAEPGPFGAGIRNEDGTAHPKNDGYQVGERFFVDVSYSPAEETFDMGSLAIESTATANPRLEVALTGQGRDLPACEFSQGPEPLRFGVLSVGEQQTLTAYVRNELETECIVSNVRLGQGSDPAFTVAPIESEVIPGGGRLAIQATFAPMAEGHHEGRVDYFISRPDAPVHSLPLRGTAQTPCLIVDPPLIDFGAVGPECQSREAAFSVFNACATPLSIEEIAIDLQYEGFSLHQVPILPRALAVGDRLEFSVSFSPQVEGVHAGAVVVDAIDPAVEGPERDVGPYVMALEGRGSHQGTQSDLFIQTPRPKVDVLIVADNSSTTEPLKDAVRQNMKSFVDFGIQNGIDFQIGVTTTGVEGMGACTAFTGFTENEAGRFVPHPDLGLPRLLTSSMSRESLFDALDRNLDVGHCHSREAPYEAARRALSAPWIVTPLEEAGNQGFLRHDAGLSIIGITDEPDHDSYWDGDRTADNSVERYVEFFQRLKPSWKKSSVKVNFVSGGYTSCYDGGVGADACPRCVRGAELTGGIWMEACGAPTNPIWEQRFNDLAVGVFGYDTSFFLRGIPADGNGDDVVDHRDIEITLDGRPYPATTTTGIFRWRYNQDANSIVFVPAYVPSPGQTIEVSYPIGCRNY